MSINLKKITFIFVVGILIALSSYSFTVFAQTTVYDQKDVVRTEPNVQLYEVESTSPQPLDLIPKEESSIMVSEDWIGPTDLTDDVSTPFVLAAIDAYKSNNLELPEKGYWVASQYYEDTKNVQVIWYPNSFDGIGPIDTVGETIYFAYFNNADLTNGTGELEYVGFAKDNNIHFSQINR